MPRKKKSETAAVAVESLPPAAKVAPSTTAAEDATPVEPAAAKQPKSFASPYKALVTSGSKGFEMGEDRRFKQMVFRFKEKPEQAVIDRLKDEGFKYRAEEKSWTIQATPATRELATNIAHELAGIELTPAR